MGNASEADDLLQESLSRALERGHTLRRGERAVAWFYRILRNAITDYYREKQRERGLTDRLWTEIRAAGEDHTPPPADWDAAVCACFRGLLPTLKPRYAQVLRRIDLHGEDKRTVARDLKITLATMDVVLHRARHALRRQLEIFCGACSRESCLACACEVRKVRRARKV
jgi:RNA polymerase sigma-70 factor (ECF subfamily)